MAFLAINSDNHSHYSHALTSMIIKACVMKFVSGQFFFQKHFCPFAKYSYILNSIILVILICYTLKRKLPRNLNLMKPQKWYLYFDIKLILSWKNSPLCDVDGKCGANQSNHGSNFHLLLLSGCVFGFFHGKEFSGLSLD